MAKEIQFILYNLPDNSGTVQAYVENETLWLTQKAMAQLFDVSIPAINQHLKNIYDTKELLPESTIKKNLIVQQEGNRQVKREQTFYSLDAIISVGYRVNSKRATLFRQWATRILNEFIRKGFVASTTSSIPHSGLIPISTKKYGECLTKINVMKCYEENIVSADRCGAGHDGLRRHGA